MGWRSAKAQMAAGTYDTPGDQKGAGFAQGFASAFVPAFNAAVDDHADEKKKARLLELKESLYRQRPRSAASGKAAGKADRLYQEALAIAKQTGLSVEEAFEVLVSHDGDSSQALDKIIGDIGSGTMILDADPLDPAGEELSTLFPEETRPTDVNAPPLETAEADVDNLGELPPPVEQSTENFVGEEFDVATTGSLRDVLTLTPKEGSGGPTAPEKSLRPVQRPTEAEGSLLAPTSSLRPMYRPTIDAAKDILEKEIAQVEEDGNTPTTSYESLVGSGVAGKQVAEIVKRSLVIPTIMKIPEIHTITDINEATAALATLDGRREYINQQGFKTGKFDTIARAMLEARIKDLTKLPDISEMLTEGNRIALQMYINHGYKEYKGVVDDKVLDAHLEQATEVFNSTVSLPKLPTSHNELVTLSNALSLGQYGDGVPTAYVNAVNTNLREQEFFQVYGPQLNVSYLTSDERTQRELELLRDAAVEALGSTHYLVTTIENAQSKEVNDRSDIPDIVDVRGNNWQAFYEKALEMGLPVLAERIALLGPEMAKAGNTEARMSKINEISKALARTDGLNEFFEATEAFVSMVSDAHSMVKILENNKDILATTGGIVPALVERVSVEADVIQSWFDKNDNKITYAQAQRQLDNFEAVVESKLNDGTMSKAAYAFALYSAQEKRLAFKIARMQQGSQGVISNADYESALSQLRPSANGETTTDSLRALLRADMNKLIAQREMLGRNVQLQLIQDLEESAGVDYTSSVFTPLDEFFNNLPTNFAEGFKWLTEEPAGKPQDEPLPPANNPPTQEGSGGVQFPGEGTVENPFVVKSREEALQIRQGSSDVYYMFEGQVYRIKGETQ